MFLLYMCFIVYVYFVRGETLIKYLSCLVYKLLVLLFWIHSVIIIISLRKSSTVCKSTLAFSPLTVKALIAWWALNFPNHPFEALKSAMSNWLANYNALLYRIGSESGMALSRAWRNSLIKLILSWSVSSTRRRLDDGFDILASN
jgi:hypothetical protein